MSTYVRLDQYKWDTHLDDIQGMVGAQIVALLVEADGQHFLAFAAKDGRVFVWDTTGDCCSESWFADITGIDALKASPIESVEEIEMPKITDNSRTRQEYDVAYGYKIKTGHGYVDIVFRNSSNGYYGGWMRMAIVDTPPPGMVEITTAEWNA